MDISISNEFVKLYPIRKNNLSLLNLWYRQVHSFGYATGGKNPEEILFQMQNPERIFSFITGIYPAGWDNCIGLVAGELKTIRNPTLWIRTFLVDTEWQRKHFGTYTFRLLSGYFAEKYRVKEIYVSVCKKNKVGISFWESIGFRCVKVLKRNDIDPEQDILILEKVL